MQLELIKSKEKKQEEKKAHKQPYPNFCFFFCDLPSNDVEIYFLCAIKGENDVKSIK